MARSPDKRRRKTAVAPVNAAIEPQASDNLQPFATLTERGICGSLFESFDHAIVGETANCIWMTGPNAKRKSETAIVALGAFKPQDEIEGMIAAQAVALHFGAMEALRRSMIDGQPAELAARFRKDGANLARAMTDMLDALDRKRGKVHQVVRVERVVVEDGGQAIVGTVSASTHGGTGGRP